FESTHARAKSPARTGALATRSRQSGAGAHQGRSVKDDLLLPNQRNRQLSSCPHGGICCTRHPECYWSFLMTLSDMSVVTSEVKVDETDIVNVKIGQDADVTIDAVPGKTFKGKVTEIGSQAVLRSSGLATTQTTTSNQEAKDFKVVVTLDSPPENLRPGLSTTAKIKTAERKNVIAIPIQALAVRSRKDLDEAAKNGKKSSNVTLAAPPVTAPGDPKKDEVQGVFVVNGKKAAFRPVETGISGVTDIEVTKGLQEGDEIVVGSYKALRTLKPEAGVKVDNSAPKKTEDQQ